MVRKIWNWQKEEWPNFTYNENQLKALEIQFSKKNELHKDYFESNHIEIGVLKHLIFDFTTVSG
ncbi:DUF4172 domain-containing protein [Formosa algae]|uniref:DUF4172 domain-containing protein n=1 Tax=Formosa algae TaxID=225843 RepID=UPI000CCE3B76|nr:DUF4172 domain-containing protein [Formosa algae]PNW27291.1 hypothetical protein BKP44_13645 [Formosa algae]